VALVCRSHHGLDIQIRYVTHSAHGKTAPLLNIYCEQESEMSEIRKVAVLGANGAMGSHSGGIFAQAGIRCLFFARSKEKAEQGIETAVKQARSDVLREYILARTYDDLEAEVPRCDWVFEALGEEMELKKGYFKRIDGCKKKDTVVSTISSSLSIEEMARETSDEFKSRFMGVHFFNPPGRLPANELIFHPLNPHSLRQSVARFCQETLQRVNIVAQNRPGFAGNRVGFCMLNEAAIYAETHGPDKIDYLLGRYTGRAMPPLATLDLVGLDVYRAIVEYIYRNTDDERHDAFVFPEYVRRMMEKGLLGRKGKSGGGFFKKGPEDDTLTISTKDLSYGPASSERIGFVEDAKRFIHDGEYKKAVDLLKSEPTEEGGIVRRFILGYVSYSYHRIGEVTPLEHGIHGIDRVMAYGFSWLPPSGWVDLFGGPKETVRLMQQEGIDIPQALENQKGDDRCLVGDIQKYLVAR
jgi:3-hydroxyacyl-CoA dehydrogenase